MSINVLVVDESSSAHSLFKRLRVSNLVVSQNMFMLASLQSWGQPLCWADRLCRKELRSRLLPLQIGIGISVPGPSDRRTRCRGESWWPPCAKQLDRVRHRLGTASTPRA